MLSFQESVMVNKTLDALEHAQATLQSEGVQVARASASNPGIPPSSLMAFLNKVLAMYNSFI